nr:hypothetical protein [Tanacetum cinerariifolium]
MSAVSCAESHGEPKGYPAYKRRAINISSDKVRRDKRKEVHARLDFGEGSREKRTREDSHHSSARARTTRPERLKVRDCLRYGDRYVLDRLGHRRQSAFDRLSESYSSSTTKSRPNMINFRDHPHGRSRPRRLDAYNKDCPEDKERFCGVRESYDDSYSYSYHDKDRSRHMKRRRDNESPLSSVPKSDSSDERYRKLKSKRHKSTDEDDLSIPWMCEEEDPFTPRIRNFESSRRTRMPNNVKTYDGTGDPEGSRQKFPGGTKYVKDHVEIHNIKQKNGETIKDFMERFKVETGSMKGVLECMRISGFMHGVNNPELTKHLNEHVPKAMEEMMITTTAFIRGEAAATSKEKGHTSWRTQDQSKRQTFEKRSDFRGHPREKRGSSRFNPLQGRQKKFLRSRWVGARPKNLKVALHPDFPDQEVAIGGTLSAKRRTELCSILKENLDIFAWQPSDMTGVPRSVAEHRLNIWEGYSPRLVDKAFDSQIGRNIEVYVDDLVVKSHTEAEMLRDIGETFRTLRKINMKLNPKKCTFGAVEGVFLGYVVAPEGINLCPNKTSASAEKSLLLFKTLKKCIKNSDFHWTAEAKQDFKQLKQHLSELLLLVAPKPKDELIVYLSATYGAISAVLMTKRGAIQTPVYFISRALQGPKLNYTPMEKLVLSLIFAAKRLKRRLQKLSGILGEHNITYRPRTSVKGQVIADFLAEMPDENLRAAPVSAASDNEAEYEALIAGLRIASQMGVQSVHGTLPDDRKEARKLRIKARQYELLEGVLYKRSFLTPWLRCVGPLQAEYVIRKIHEGSCSMHAGPRSMVAKAIRQGYYWPTMHWDPRDMIRTCNDCQIHLPVTRNPQQPLTLITAPWPFYKWGIDIAGPFPEGPSKVKFLIVTMDYFTKWIEAKAVATITGSQVKKFMWDNIVCRFERRERAAIREAKAKLKMTKYYNAMVRSVTFRPGDFVYRSNDASHTVEGWKLGPKWEGPYEVTEALGAGTTDGTVLQRTWNIANLKRCYL